MAWAGQFEDSTYRVEMGRWMDDVPARTKSPVMTKSQALDELRRARLELEFATEGLDSFAPVLRALRRIEMWLARPPRIALIGEFNSGKSTLANYLVGIDSLPTSVVSNTCIPTLLSYASEPTITAVYADGRRELLSAVEAADGAALTRLEVGLPSDRLRRLQVLDLPGLDDPSMTGVPYELSIHHPDALLWCTVATQAWKESERAAWLDMPGYLRDRGLLVATFRDLLSDPADQLRVLDRLNGDAAPLFREVVMVSAKSALAALPVSPVTALSAGSHEEPNGAVDRLVAYTEGKRVAAALALVGRLAKHTLKRMDREPVAANPRLGNLD